MNEFTTPLRSGIKNDRGNSSVTSLIFITVLTVYTYLYYYFLVSMADSGEALLMILLRFVPILLVITLILHSVNLKQQCLWFILCLSFFISFAKNSSGAEYFCNTLVLLGTLAALPHLKTTKRSLYLFFALYLLFVGTIILKDYLTPNLINPNTMAQVLFGLISILAVFAVKARALWRKCFLLVIIAVLTVITNEYDCRTVMLAIALLCVCLIFRIYKSKTLNKYLGAVVLGIWLTSLIVAYIYSIPLYDALGDKSITIFGKALFSGRQMLWRAAFEQIKPSFLFGIGNTFVVEDSYAGSEIANLHNQALGYLIVFGAFFLLSFLAIFKNLILKINLSGGKLTVVYMVVWSVIDFFETSFYSVPSLFITLTAIILYQIEKLAKGIQK